MTFMQKKCLFHCSKLLCKTLKNTLKIKFELTWTMLMGLILYGIDSQVMRTAMSSIFRSSIQLFPGIQQLVERAACDGAVSCMKIIFFLNGGCLLRSQGIKLSWRKFRYVSAFIFTPSVTLNGPTSSLPIISAQNMRLPPPCCRLTLDDLLQPSGPSRVSLHSSVKRTVWKSVLTYFLGHWSHWFLCLMVQGVWQAWQLRWGSGNE